MPARPFGLDLLQHRLRYTTVPQQASATCKLHLPNSVKNHSRHNATGSMCAYLSDKAGTAWQWCCSNSSNSPSAAGQHHPSTTSPVASPSARPGLGFAPHGLHLFTRAVLQWLQPPITFIMSAPAAATAAARKHHCLHSSATITAHVASWRQVATIHRAASWQLLDISCLCHQLPLPQPLLHQLPAPAASASAAVPVCSCLHQF